MINAVGAPQSLLLLGGTSDIGLAVARAFARQTPTLRVVLAARPSPRRTAATEELTALGCSVRALDFDAQVVSDHAAVIAAAAEDGDLDVSVVAYGVLGDNERAWTDMDTAVDLARTNYVGPVASGVALAEQVRRQGDAARRRGGRRHRRGERRRAALGAQIHACGDERTAARPAAGVPTAPRVRLGGGPDLRPSDAS